jgi:hypothetical protein
VFLKERSLVDLERKNLVSSTLWPYSKVRQLASSRHTGPIRPRKSKNRGEALRYYYCRESLGAACEAEERWLPVDELGEELVNRLVTISVGSASAT